MLAYIQLEQRADINDLIKDEREDDKYGFKNRETFNVAQHFSTSVNVDELIFDDLYSLRDLGGSAAVISSDLDVTVRAAQAELTTESNFDLGTLRQVHKLNEDDFTNLIRSGDTIWQSSTWKNDGEFSFTDLRITNLSNAVAEVTSLFDNKEATLAELGWSDLPGEGEVATINTSFHINGKAGSVLDTTEVGYKLDAYGEYSWDTTEMEQFAVKNLITWQGDLSYDGAVDMADLAALNKGAKDGGSAHDVDANYDGFIDFRDLAVIDKEWGESLHTGDGKFTGSDKISMAELFEQEGHQWDSSAFAKRNAIEGGEQSEADGFVNVLTNDSPGLINGPIGGVEELELLLQQQYATPV